MSINNLETQISFLLQLNNEMLHFRLRTIDPTLNVSDPNRIRPGLIWKLGQSLDDDWLTEPTEPIEAVASVTRADIRTCKSSIWISYYCIINYYSSYSTNSASLQVVRCALASRIRLVAIVVRVSSQRLDLLLAVLLAGLAGVCRSLLVTRGYPSV